MPLLKGFDIFEVSHGQKVLLLHIPADNPMEEKTEDDIQNMIKNILELFYYGDKVKLYTLLNGTVIRAMDQKTFIVEAKIVEKLNLFPSS
jgi:hypothetical protein